MILTKFDVIIRDGAFRITFNHGYKCDTFMNNVVSSWIYYGESNTIVFRIGNYEFSLHDIRENDTVELTITSENNDVTMYSSFYNFTVTDECVIVECNESIHKFTGIFNED